MKDPAFYILSEIYRLLNGNISVNVYNVEQSVDDNVTEWIKTSSAFSLPRQTKDVFYFDTFVNIQVITLVPDNAISEQRKNEITNEVIGILTPTPTTCIINSNVDFNIMQVMVEQLTDLERDRQNANVVLRKNIELVIKSKQKN